VEKLPKCVAAVLPLSQAIDRHNWVHRTVVVLLAWNIYKKHKHSKNPIYINMKQYTKTIRSVWLDNRANTYLPITEEESSNLVHTTTQGGKLVAEFLTWIQQHATYTLKGTEYTRVYISEQQYTYILMRWNGIRYATDKWKTV